MVQALTVTVHALPGCDVARVQATAGRVIGQRMIAQGWRANDAVVVVCSYSDCVHCQQQQPNGHQAT